VANILGYRSVTQFSDREDEHVTNGTEQCVYVNLCDTNTMDEVDHINCGTYSTQ
jgi:hypothetical protein